SGAAAGSAVRVAPAEEEPEAAPAAPRRYYAVQVRARESWEGAGRLAEYFRGLGYADLDTEPDGRDAAGDALFTVFVGRYAEAEEARRACERLKEETRRKPYRYGRDTFQGAFVVARGRASR
ncbi:MAG: SPOR domain-containing protein, partial [Planctomycetota bacterium]